MDNAGTRVCEVCGAGFDPSEPAATLYAKAGEWLAEEIWHDAGELCPSCRENRARLVMMYCHEFNT